MNGDDFLGVTVARGPVPRDLSTAAENARNPETPAVCCSDRRTARDRPSPYVLYGDFLFVTVARGPRMPYAHPSGCPPRSLHRCGKRPQPRDPGYLLLRPTHGEGQALALRAMRRFISCYRSAGAVTAALDDL